MASSALSSIVLERCHSFEWPLVASRSFLWLMQGWGDGILVQAGSQGSLVHWLNLISSLQPGIVGQVSGTCYCDPALSLSLSCWVFGLAARAFLQSLMGIYPGVTGAIPPFSERLEIAVAWAAGNCLRLVPCLVTLNIRVNTNFFFPRSLNYTSDDDND